MADMNSSNTGIHNDKKKALNKYTQRQWDRTVGMGTVPEIYKAEEIHDKCGTDECCQKCDPAVPPIVPIVKSTDSED